jgi:hypothetical protein
VESPSPNTFTIGRYEFTPTTPFASTSAAIRSGTGAEGRGFGAAFSGPTHRAGNACIDGVRVGDHRPACGCGEPRDAPDLHRQSERPTRVTITGDPTWDGLLKGAGAGVVFSLLTDAKDDPEYFVPITASSAAIGWVIDAINTTGTPTRSIRGAPARFACSRSSHEPPAVLLGLSY